MDPRETQKARDRMLEKLLPRALRAAAAAPKFRGAECPDANILAAYAERALSEPEAARWEKHFSTCALCQEILSTIAASEVVPVEGLQVAAAAAARAMSGVAAEPAAAAEVRTPQLRTPEKRRIFDFRWMVPALAAAAVVAIWIGMRTPEWLHRNTPQVAQTGSQTRPASLEAPKPPVETAQNNPPENAQAGSSKEKKIDEAAKAPSPASPRMPAKVPAGLSANAAGMTTREEPPKVAAALPAQPPAGQAVEPAQKRAPTGDKAKAVDQLSAPPREMQKKPALEGQPAKSESVAVETTRGAGTARERKGTAEGPANVPVGAAVAGAPFAASTAVLYVQITSPDPSVLWRVGSFGLIERSADGGQTWRAQASNVRTDLLAGSAPTETICWVVGRAGTILRTTDGEHWEKLRSPAPLDWTEVAARDAEQASVRAASGQQYETSNGGSKWVAVALKR